MKAPAYPMHNSDQARYSLKLLGRDHIEGRVDEVTFKEVSAKLVAAIAAFGPKPRLQIDRSKLIDSDW